MISQLSNPWWIFILLGICAGVLSGALGIGAGIILVPTLVLFCDFGQKSAQGMSLAVMVPMVMVGALRYWKNPEVEMHGTTLGLIILGALAGVLAGTELASRLPSPHLRKIFAAVLLLVALKMFVGSARLKQRGPDDSLTSQKITNFVESEGTNNESKE
ncbi:MAG: TSUP family transporter [Phycisphaerae bacterium]|nr:sulfite exporter TauE/SafE family protein [Phycisphaerae bacterium]NIP52361.1 sulfite exporter TauE/SafE family protein [Phycisphaerae bacterium]NIS51352.1 sulfite exporter TauE/SafE family protein [Phycisphaerae bacterium]NIU08964.1 sulfite exporter TauE/SafE family protein [Phycisphaerae bacterium]NIU56633.1 TSUP family transporter [Phycisphaerae bacterium]